MISGFVIFTIIAFVAIPGSELAHLRRTAQAELDALQAEMDATGSGALVAQRQEVPVSAAVPPSAVPHGPVLSPAPGFVWVVAASRPLRVVVLVAAWFHLVRWLGATKRATKADGAVIFVELIPVQDLRNYVGTVATPAPPCATFSSGHWGYCNWTGG